MTTPRVYGKSQRIGPSGGGGVKSARFYITAGGAYQEVPSGGSGQTMIDWSADGAHEGWDQIGCTITNDGYTILPPQGIYLVTMFVHLSTPACSGGRWVFIGPGTGDAPDLKITGYAQLGQEPAATWTHIVDVCNSYYPLSMTITQYTGGTLSLLGAEMGIVRLSDTENTCGG